MGIGCFLDLVRAAPLPACAVCRKGARIGFALRRKAAKKICFARRDTFLSTVTLLFNAVDLEGAARRSGDIFFAPLRLCAKVNPFKSVKSDAVCENINAKSARVLALGLNARIFILEIILDIDNLYGYISQMSMSPAFTPVPRQRSRHDGWSADKQSAFIDALSQYGIVRAAAEKVGMHAASAYKLREADGAESFSAAWDKALKTGMAQLVDIAMDRAIHGVAVPHFYKGEQVGERRWFDNKLLMFMMRHTAPQMFGRFAAEVDLAQRSDQDQAAAEARRLDQLTRAEALLAATEAELEELESSNCAGKDLDRALQARELSHQLLQRRDRLITIVAQLRQVDTAREAEASIDQLVAQGRYSARHGSIFKRQLRAGAP